MPTPITGNTEMPAQLARKQDNLDRAAKAVQGIAMDCRLAAVGMLPSATEAARKEAGGKANAAGLAAWEVVNLLVDAGAVVPERVAQAEKAERGDLSLASLAQMDSPKMRKLLELLDAAQAVAEEIDAERGQVLPADLPLLPGESRGTGYAEDVSMIAVRLRGEVYGKNDGRE